MLTKDDVQKAQKDQNAERTGVLKNQMAATQKTDAQNGEKIDSHNYSLDDVSLGKRVRIARKEKRLTQEELAGLCNCTPTHICNIENGKIGISLELLFKISILLGKSMDYFVMDNPGVDPQVKINAEIAPKLARCNPQMLDIVDTILDKLIHYQDSFRHSAYESCDIIEGQICGFGTAAESSVGVSDVRSSILDLLRPMGITERYFGVRQLIQAVEMVMENPDTIHALQKEVFSEIAAQYSVSWGAIERNLRIISKRAWDTDPVYMENLAGYPMSKRPSASQLIEIILHSVQRE